MEELAISLLRQSPDHSWEINHSHRTKAINQLLKVLFIIACQHHIEAVVGDLQQNMTEVVATLQEIM